MPLEDRYWLLVLHHLGLVWSNQRTSWREACFLSLMDSLTSSFGHRYCHWNADLGGLLAAHFWWTVVRSLCTRTWLLRKSGWSTLYWALSEIGAAILWGIDWTGAVTSIKQGRAADWSFSVLSTFEGGISCKVCAQFWRMCYWSRWDNE